MEVNYFEDEKLAVFDGMLYRRDRRTGYYLASRPSESGKRERLHIAVWKYHNGDIPKGHHIHHIDHDKANNEISNLQCMPAAEHSRLHGEEMPEDRKAKLRKNLIENAVPKSKEWHASEDGREWHRKHMKKIQESWEPIEYECTQCGKKFMSKNRYSPAENRFCCNNCKSAFRRASHVDDETRKCIVCGADFTVNKYSKVSRCKKCSNVRVKKKLTCEYCGNEFEASRKARFCCNRCRLAFKRKSV